MFILIISEEEGGVGCNIIVRGSKMIIVGILLRLFMDMIKEFLNPLIRKDLEDVGKQRIN